MCSGLNWLYASLHQSPIGIKALTTGPCLLKKTQKSSVPCRARTMGSGLSLAYPAVRPEQSAWGHGVTLESGKPSGRLLTGGTNSLLSAAHGFPICMRLSSSYKFIILQWCFKIIIMRSWPLWVQCSIFGSHKMPGPPGSKRQAGSHAGCESFVWWRNYGLNLLLLAHGLLRRAHQR